MRNEIFQVTEDDGFLWCPICGDLPLIHYSHNENAQLHDWAATCLKRTCDERLDHSIQVWGDTYEEVKANWNRRA